VVKFIKRFQQTGKLTRFDSQVTVLAMYIAEGTITQQAGSGRKTVITDEVRRIVEKQMHGDDETTASQLHVLLASLGHTLNVRTILCCRTSLVWVFGGECLLPAHT